MNVNLNPLKLAGGALKERIRTEILKFGVPQSGGQVRSWSDRVRPPYERQYDPRWVYNIRENHSLINNAIEEKVSQTTRRGFDDWEKRWEAKCPNCHTEFETDEQFREMLPDGVTDGVEDLDFDTPRRCPECDEKVDFETPDENMKEVAKSFFDQANHRVSKNSHLVPDRQPDVGQSFLEVLKEVGWDIQSFDDGWMLFQREYKMDKEGRVLDWDFQGAHRGAPEYMRYSMSEVQEFGGEFWVCLKCREEGEGYEPETEPKECSECGRKTYECFAYSVKDIGSDRPLYYYIRGEFVHASEYTPSKYYGRSPIFTLYDEARALEQMDRWYRDAYEERRAPRGALIFSASNSESVLSHNKKQLKKLRNDPNYIPALMNDKTEDSGDPIDWVTLLESPAEMQHMEMREWFKERISGKYGVTAIMMSGTPEDSGLSQSMEVQVSNRSADRLRTIFNNVFIPALLGQIGAEGWDRKLAPVEEEDERRDVELTQKELQVAEQAANLGLEVEYHDDEGVNIKGGEIKVQGQDGGPLGGGLDAQDGDPDSNGSPFGPDAGSESDFGGMGGDTGGPAGPDNRPVEGRDKDNDGLNFPGLGEALSKGKDVDVYNHFAEEWQKAKVKSVERDRMLVETESGVEFKINPSGELRTVS